MSRRKEEEAKAFFAVMMAAAFCMFAGAAGYHQYLKTQKTKKIREKINEFNHYKA